MKSKSFLKMGFAALIASCLITSGASADPKKPQETASPAPEVSSKQADSGRAGNLTATIHDLSVETVLLFEERYQPYTGTFDIKDVHDAPIGGMYRIELQRPEGAVANQPGAIHSYLVTVNGKLESGTTVNMQWHKDKGLVMSCMKEGKNIRNVMIFDLANPFKALGLNSALTTATTSSDQQKPMSEKGRRLLKLNEQIDGTPDPVAEILDTQFGIAKEKPGASKTN